MSLSLLTPFSSPVSGPKDVLSIPHMFFDDFIEGRSFTTNNASVASAQGKFSELANMGDWLVTLVDGGTDNGEVIVIADDAAGGHLTLTTNDADDDSIEMQMNGEAWKLATGKTLVFEVRMKGADVSEFDWFVGLAITDTTVMTAVTDRIGFECPDSTGDIDAICEKDSSQTTTDSAQDLADDTFVTLRFEAEGTGKVRYYVDGSLVATHTTNIPENEALTPTICVRNDGAAANTMTLDYIFVARDR